MKNLTIIISMLSIFMISCKNENPSNGNKDINEPITQINERNAYAEEVKIQDYKILYYEKAAPNQNVPKIYDSVTEVTTTFSTVPNSVVNKRGVIHNGDLVINYPYGLAKFNSSNNISITLNSNPTGFYTRGVYDLGGDIHTIARNINLEAKLIKWDMNFNIIDTVINFPKISNGELHVCTIGNISYITNGEFYSYNHTTGVLATLSSNVGFNRYNKMICAVDKVVLSNQFKQTKYAGYEAQLEIYDTNTNLLNIEFNNGIGPIINIQRMNEKIFYTFNNGEHYELNMFDLITKTNISLSVGAFDQFMIHSLSLNGRLAVYSLADEDMNTVYMYYDNSTNQTGNLSTLGATLTANTYMYDVFNGDGVSWFVSQRQDVYQRPDLVHVEDNIPTLLQPSNFPVDQDGNFLSVNFLGVGYDKLIVTYQGLMFTVDKDGIFTQIADSNDSPAYSDLYYY